MIRPPLSKTEYLTATLMLSNSLQSLDLSLIIARFMRRQNIARVVRITHVLLSFLTLFIGVITVVVLVNDYLLKTSLRSELESQIPSIAKLKMPTPGTSQPDSSQNWNVISSIKPFGSLDTVAKSSVPKKPTRKPSPLMLTLIGTFITTGQEPYAIIESKKKREQEMFLLEDSVFDQATLKKIFKDRVEIDHNGEIEVLFLDDSIGSSGDSGVSEDSDDFVIDEAEVDKGLENLPLLLTQARAVPYFKDGRAIGLRLFAIKTGSLYEKVGLRNGDILKSINGNSLGDISQALKLFEKLKEERSITLLLERAKKEREFRYTIR